MGNVFSASISCDAAISRCLDCTVRKTAYTCQLQDNLDNLETELEKLIEARNDVLIEVTVAEQRGMKRLEQVQGWLSRVQDVETEAEKLKQGRQEFGQLCVGGFCSKNCNPSYKFGKSVFKTLRIVENLRSEGDFKEVAQTAPETPVDQRPITPAIVGLESTFDKVWRCLTEELAGIIAIYGMGGVGKTTLLTLINNKFLDFPNNFDVVIWAVVSKDLELEKIQESIAKKIGLFNESWKSRSLEDKAQEIFKILSKKKFLLLLDDIWERVDLIKVGLPPPTTRSASKVVFTTREFDVSGSMKAHKSFKVECLRYQDAWRLFEETVGKEILDSHPNIPELAETVAKECGGLPLALIVVGQSMACKKTPQEWEHAIEVLRSSASKFSGMERWVYSRLKFSYDLLPSDTIRFCLLYCCLFPEDYRIKIEDLIDYWICEGVLDEYDGIGARNQGYSIIGTLTHACLLEEEEDDLGYNCVKMHDVIRDMTLWIASTTDHEKEKFLVLAGVGLTEAPSIEKWKDVTRMSLMRNKIRNLSKSPICPRLRTLFLSRCEIQVVESDFFQSMTSLRVLDLSYNINLRLAFQFSDFVSLQHLDLSSCRITSLPVELKYLINLRCLKLECTFFLRSIPPKVISNLKMLRILRMFGCGHYGSQEEDSILFGDGELLVEELLCLKQLNVLTITLKSLLALQRLLSSPILQSSIRSLCLKTLEDSKSLDVSSLASLRHLEKYHLWDCVDLEELKIEYTRELKNIRVTHGLHSLRRVSIFNCRSLRHVTGLICAPNLKYIDIHYCESMEEIIKLDEVPAEAMEDPVPFARLQFLHLQFLRKLKSIYSNPLPFPHLKEMSVSDCPELRKLPLDCNSASGRKFIIEGEGLWWKKLQWEDQATQSAFLPYFKAMDPSTEFE
ncbi:NBS-LRR type disease resistance protein [Melia azedarach]|uniref:NBS-LRR type disease resistance protein n=1 Tax=Melia azedarach TaxID=155640 RepID=A0ACC1YF17_MELAZ|nr:NBS-LRR type disease resistance protein [Melia azedarach]